MILHLKKQEMDHIISVAYSNGGPRGPGVPPLKFENMALQLLKHIVTNSLNYALLIEYCGSNIRNT